jgi:AraC-like DNA-binding protein
MRFYFKNLEDLQIGVNGAELQVRQLATNPTRGWTSHLTTESTVCSAGHYEGQMEFSGSFSNTHCTVGMTLSKNMVAQQFTKPTSSSALVLFPPGEDSISTYNGSMDYIGLGIQPDELLTLADRQNITVAPTLLGNGVATPLAAVLTRIFPALHEALSGQNKVKHSGELDDLIEEVLCYSLESLANRSHSVPAGDKNRHYARLVNKCREYIDLRALNPLTVKSLCEYCATPRLTVHRAFLSELGVSPGEYIRSVRLSGARAELIAFFGQTDRPITTVATRWGFTELGKFSAYYKRAFGELPSETLASLAIKSK